MFSFVHICRSANINNIIINVKTLKWLLIYAICFIQYCGNSLEDFTLARRLVRFFYLCLHLWITFTTSGRCGHYVADIVIHVCICVR